MTLVKQDNKGPNPSFLIYYGNLACRNPRSNIVLSDPYFKYDHDSLEYDPPIQKVNIVAILIGVFAGLLLFKLIVR